MCGVEVGEEWSECRVLIAGHLEYRAHSLSPSSPLNIPFLSRCSVPSPPLLCLLLLLLLLPLFLVFVLLVLFTVSSYSAVLLLLNFFLSSSSMLFDFNAQQTRKQTSTSVYK